MAAGTSGAADNDRHGCRECPRRRIALGCIGAAAAHFTLFVPMRYTKALRSAANSLDAEPELGSKSGISEPLGFTGRR